MSTGHCKVLQKLARSLNTLVIIRGQPHFCQVNDFMCQVKVGGRQICLVENWIELTISKAIAVSI